MEILVLWENHTTKLFISQVMLRLLLGHLSGHQTMETHHSELRALGTHYLRLDVVGDRPKIG
jgi:hypothetical protein